MKQRIATKVEEAIFDELSPLFRKALIESVRSVVSDEALQDAVIAEARTAAEATAREMLEKPETHFASVYDFVNDFLVQMYPYAPSRERDVRWTARWWAYPEAVARLSALWYRFEQLKKAEPATYLETFLRVHADYHMRVLMTEGGVFDSVRRTGEASIPLPSDPLDQK